MKLSPWVKLPTVWIEEKGLNNYQWGRDGQGSTAIAGLMTLIVLAQHADPETGTAKLTYDQLTQATGLSRSKLSDGLDLIEANEHIVRGVEGRSTYGLEDYDPERGWAKLPARGLYSGGRLGAFQHFKLRQMAELDAIKAYLTFAARRDRDTNAAQLSYVKIEEYAGIPPARIKAATSMLAATGLVVIDQLPSTQSEYGISNAYRLTHVEPYQHRGTLGRSEMAAATDDIF